MPSAADVLISFGFHPAITRATQDDFLRACKEGPDEVVRAFLDLGMDPHTRAEFGLETPLIKAAEGARIANLELLLSRGADLELRDNSQDTALRTAFNWSHPEVARWLAARGASVDAPDGYGASILHRAIYDDKIELVDLLLELHANPSFRQGDQSPMSCAIKSGKIDALRKLLDAGASADMVIDDHGVTALHEAVRRELGDMVALLLERGGTATIADAHQRTAIDFALLTDQTELAESLAKRSGAKITPQQRVLGQVFALIKSNDCEKAFDLIEREYVPLNAGNAFSSTLLRAFVEKGYVDGVKQLLARGAATTASAIESAVGTNNLELLELLIAAGAPMFGNDGELAGFQGAVWEGHTHLVVPMLARCSADERAKLGKHVYAAVMQSHLSIVQAFVHAGVPLDHTEGTREPPLAATVSSWFHHDIAVALLDGGARIDALDRNSDTALHVCASHYKWEESREPTLRLLLERGAPLDAINWQDQTPIGSAGKEPKAVMTRILVTEPLDAKISIAELAKRQSWATLPLFLEAERGDVLPELLDAMTAAGLAIVPHSNVRSDGLLELAIKNQDEVLVEDLVRRGVDVDRRTSYDSSPLRRAVGGDSTNIVRILLDAGADVHALDGSGGTVARLAMWKPQHLALLAERGVTFDGRVSPPIVAAVRAQSIEAVEFLLARRVPLDVFESNGDTPLTSAIEKGSIEIVNALLAAGASPSLANWSSGETPVLQAAKLGNVELVRALIDHGADLTAVNHEGETGLQVLARRTQLRHAFAELLAQHHIDVTPPMVTPLDPAMTTSTPIWDAVYRADAEAVISAIDDGKLGVDDRDLWGVTALMIAVLFGDNAYVDQLLERGANVDLADLAGSHAIDYGGFGAHGSSIATALAAKSKDDAPPMARLNAQAARSLLHTAFTDALSGGELRKVVAMIVEKKVHPFLGTNGQAPLLAAIDAGDEDLVQLLLGLGLPATIRDRWGRSALDLANDAGAVAIIEALSAKKPNRTKKKPAATKKPKKKRRATARS